MKRTDLEKLKGVKLNSQLKGYGAPDRFGAQASAPLDRREQRKLDQARGLVPFAVKIDSDLVEEVRALARSRQADLNELVAVLLKKGLAG